MKRILALLAVLLASSGSAQESASYNLAEHTFNAGGTPADGVVLASTSYKITLDAIGDSVTSRALGGSSYHIDAGFISGYPPPGEVQGLYFDDAETLVWSPEASVGDYTLYRESIVDLSGGGYGLCEQHDLIDETTTDPDVPSDGDGYFYLVTARNRLNEEGTKGTDSSGAERPNPAPCP